MEETPKEETGERCTEKRERETTGRKISSVDDPDDDVSEKEGDWRVNVRTRTSESERIKNKEQCKERQCLSRGFKEFLSMKILSMRVK